MRSPRCAAIGPVATAAILIASFAPLSTAVARACEERAPTRETHPGPHDYSLGVSAPKLWSEGDEGEPLSLIARIVDTCGTPVAGARIRVVHADHHGEHKPGRWRADLRSDDRGEFRLLTVYPGYAGGMARHIHFMIDHPEHGALVTRLFFRNDPAAGPEVEDISVALEEVRRDGAKGWVAGYEFVLPPR